MSVPQVSSSSPVPVGQSTSMPAPEALTSDTATNACSPTPRLPACSYFVRDSEQLITASEALLILQEGPRTSQSSLLAETIPETQDISQTPDISQTSNFSRDDEVPRRTPTADPIPYPD